MCTKIEKKDILCEIACIYENKVTRFYSRKGENLLKVLWENGVYVPAHCGGNKTCGKCTVMIDHEAVLACAVHVENDIEVILPSEHNQSNSCHAEIMTGFKNEHTVFHSRQLVIKIPVKLQKPSLEDNRDDYRRLVDAVQLYKSKDAVVISNGEISENIDLIMDLQKMIKSFDRIESEGAVITAVVCDGKLVSVEKGDTANQNYGIAVDVGTTTISVYLVDMFKDKVIGSYSSLNPQKNYGADVISRIKYMNENEEGLSAFRNLVIAEINKAAVYFTENNKIDINHIYAMTIAGNTTMMHILQGISPEGIAVSPFIPGFTGMLKIKPEEGGYLMNGRGTVVFYPSVSAYVGADIVSGIVFTGMHKSEETNLFIDIGTNGEMAIGNQDRIITCSTAAGPAFEGAEIRFGTGGIKGAIDRISTDPYEVSVIGKGANDKETAVTGICGSGIISAVSMLLNKGLIDETGAFTQIDENKDDVYDSGFEKERLRKFEGERAFLIADSGKKEAHEDIYITQKDIRKIQNAKAAICAGIFVLIKEAGIAPDDIDKAYLAGGFGNYIDQDDAVRIGLLPGFLSGKIHSVGNSAGGGVVAGLLSCECLGDMLDVKKMIDYVELSDKKEFTELYVESMLF